ncbi:serine arginine-rich splicing factor 3 [Pelobates cultripes]|uniref:Serine/arginine-rich splicing factor 3 n=1 Tax=Pelobates cultripes TaxID=61616 RepID=A0AAD1QZE2_PELCU|nr:serine arginine-rich splicing factor 3 [Pelobates cultripes]
MAERASCHRPLNGSRVGVTYEGSSYLDGDWLAMRQASCNVNEAWPADGLRAILCCQRPVTIGMHRDSCPLDCKVYVGNLGNNGNKTELERAFGYYGPLRSVWVARNPPGFAFVEFEDPRDAADAVRELDGRTLCGCRVRVELSNGEKRSRNRGPPPSWNRRPRDDYRRRSPPARRRSPRRRSFSRSRSRSLSRERRRERSISRERNHKPSRSFSRSRSRSRSNERK